MRLWSAIASGGRHCWQEAAGLLRAGIDFASPPMCAFCGREEAGVALAGHGPPLCVQCRADLAPRIEHACRRCAAPVGPFLDTAQGCIHCCRDRFAFDGVVRLGVYEGPLRSACLRMKRAGGELLAAALAGLLYQRHGDELEQAAVDLVVGVPQHWTQRLGRPHNPAAAVGRELSRLLRTDFGAPILAKVRRTAVQAALPPTLRRTNLRGAFRVRVPEAVSGRAVLLADDVLTTGSTAHEAARMLKASGARRVLVAVLARGLGRS